MNAPGGVMLLVRRAAVLVKHLVDEVRHRRQLRLGQKRESDFVALITGE
jgi:hypothetical protein